MASGTMSILALNQQIPGDKLTVMEFPDIVVNQPDRLFLNARLTPSAINSTNRACQMTIDTGRGGTEK